jgi:tRNA dimethylallyltransferase
MTSTKHLIVVVGATGSGKTDISLRLATHFGAPIISTDSRQVYKGIPIGTAQPTAEQLATVEHHFIASHSLTDNFNCGEYEVQALARLEELFRAHDVVVAVGGSGLYIQALCEGMDDLPQADEQLRQSLMERLQNEGIESLLADLERLDPDYYAQVDHCNPSRVVRAVEVCMQTGQPYSSLRKGERHKRNFNIIKIGIEWERATLYDRINRRVDMMIDEGLEAEARSVYHLRHLNSLQTVGYREMFDYFDGTTTRKEAIELIKRNSRRYAKRQMTWFRRDADIEWFEASDVESMIDFLENKI